MDKFIQLRDVSFTFHGDFILQSHGVKGKNKSRFCMECVRTIPKDTPLWFSVYRKISEKPLGSLCQGCAMKMGAVW